MTEIAARPPRPRGFIRLIQVLAAAAGAALLVVGGIALRPDSGPAPSALLHAPAIPKALKRVSAEAHPVAHKVPPAHIPARVSNTVSAALSSAAARGVDRPFFTSGSLFATAGRVAQWRPLVARAVRGTHIRPALLEAIVYVESSGRADAVGRGRAGLTQLTPSAARRGGLHVNVVRSRALTHRIVRAERRGAYGRARQLRRWRARYDQRFAPARALRGTARYLTSAGRVLGRRDLAVASSHLGIRNLRLATRGFAEDSPSYAQLYFGSSPDEHRAIWHRISKKGAAARDYYWKVLAAKRIMHLRRTNGAALVFEDRQQAQKNSAEEFMHPRYRTPRFASPAAIARGWRHRVLRTIPRNARRTHIAIGPFFGQEAHKLGRSKRLYRGLRPATLDVLLYIGKRVHEISGSHKPLILTSALRDNRYQQVLMNVNANAARTYSIHTTGYAFDIARAYASRRQAAAFEFVLERLEAANAISYIREAAAIHIAVASDAQRKLRLLARA